MDVYCGSCDTFSPGMYFKKSAIIIFSEPTHYSLKLGNRASIAIPVSQRGQELIAQSSRFESVLLGKRRGSKLLGPRRGLPQVVDRVQC
jgi:hypothetical protein